MDANNMFMQAKSAVEKFNVDVSKYLDKHSLSDLPAFDKLQTKEHIGSIYRDDQVYYEKLSDFRSKYFGMSAFLLKLKSETTERVLLRDIDETKAYVDKKEEMLRNMSYSAKDRVKFYQNVIYLVSNMTYGDF